jgi:hypothetical protein
MKAICNILYCTGQQPGNFTLRILVFLEVFKFIYFFTVFMCFFLNYKLVSCLIYTSFPTEEHLPEDSKTGACCNLNTFSIFHSIPQYLLHTVKGARGKVSFDSQNDK